MDTTVRIALWIHILAGTVALLVAPGALLTAKGGRAHRRWGKIYFWAMAVVAATALGVGYWRSRYFLMLVAVFSFYAALSGYRALFHKRPETGQRADALDWTAAALAAGAGGTLVALGILKPTPGWREIGTVSVVFGTFSIVLALRDAWGFVRPPADRNAWWYRHMSNMMGSYLAALTAFSVVNFSFLPINVKWLWPTVLGTPAIIAWVTYYKLRFSRARPAPQAAT